MAQYSLRKKKTAANSGYVAPDISGAFAMYTVNNSWAGFVFRQGSFPRQGVKYRAAGGYASINLSFYHDFERAGEQQFDFNIKMVPLLINVSKRIAKSDVYLGLKYTYMNNQLSPDFEERLPDFINEEDLESTTAPDFFLTGINEILFSRQTTDFKSMRDISRTIVGRVVILHSGGSTSWLCFFGR